MPEVIENWEILVNFGYLSIWNSEIWVLFQDGGPYKYKPGFYAVLNLAPRL